MRVAVVSPIPTPYKDAFWRRLDAQPGVDVDVFYCSPGKADRPWGKDSVGEGAGKVLAGRNLLDDASGRSLFWNPGIWRLLEDGNYDRVVATGYNHFTMMIAIVWCLWRRVPYLLVWESHSDSGNPRLPGWMRRSLSGWIARGAAGLLSTGILAERYLVSLGVREERCVRTPNVPDFEALEEGLAQEDDIRARVRSSAGIGAEQRVVLFVGRFVASKRVRDLLDAFAGSASRATSHLVLVGDGIERPALETQAEALRIADRVTFTGFLSPAGVRDWYLAADLFVLPSAETWGVAPLEALGLGLPVLLSDRVGCAQDALSDSTVGRTFGHGDEGALRTALNITLDAPPTRGAVRESWRTVRAEMDPERLARQLADYLAEPAQ